jgi:hypothetical protein
MARASSDTAFSDGALQSYSKSSRSPCGGSEREACQWCGQLKGRQKSLQIALADAPDSNRGPLHFE